MGTLTDAEEQELKRFLANRSREEELLRPDPFTTRSVNQRLVDLESAMPNNAFKLKPGDGHHHMESVRVLEAGVNKGFGFDLDFVGGTTVARVANSLTNRKVTINPNAGRGAFEYDYLIDPLYTGTAGAVGSTSDTTRTWKNYATIKEAVDDANANRQTSQQHSSFRLTSGGGASSDPHIITEEIVCDPPTSGGYSFWGSGALGGTEIICSTAAIDMFSVVGTSYFEFHDIYFHSLRSGIAVRTITWAQSIEVLVESCRFSELSDGVAIHAGGGGTIQNCLFAGAGDNNIFATLIGPLNIVGNRFASSGFRHIDLNAGADTVNIIGNTFQGLGSTDEAIRVHPSGGRQVLIEGNMFSNNGKAITFPAFGGITFMDGLRINGNLFAEFDTDAIIDFSDLGTSTVDDPISITNNHFSGQLVNNDPLVFAIRGSTKLNNATIANNTFQDFFPGNEIADWEEAGNVAFHNYSVDGSAVPVRQLLADIGNVPGHVGGTTAPQEVAEWVFELDAGSSLTGLPIVA